MQQSPLNQQIRKFLPRIRTILSWRYAAVCGTIGAAIGLLADIGDWRGVWTIEAHTLAAIVIAVTILGIGYALCRPLPLEIVAQLIDRRACLKDRTISALLCKNNPFAEALQEDAIAHLEQLHPSQLFCFRLTAWHGAMMLLIVALLISQFLPKLPLPFTSSIRQDRREAKKMVEKVQNVVKPIIERANEPEASELEKQIARQIQDLYRRAQKGRLSKKEAMIRLNKLLSDAQKLEQQVQRKVQLVSTKAVTAAQLLQQQLKSKALASHMRALQPLLKRMQDLERMLQSQNLTPTQREMLQNELKMLQQTVEMLTNFGNQSLRQHMETLSSKIAQLQQMLQSGINAEGRKLSKEERELLEQHLKGLQQQLHALRLSKEAREFLRKLVSDPNFQEAMKRLSELRNCLEGMSGGKMGQISPEELERMVRELERMIEELAKQFGDDEKIRQLAKQLLEAVKNLKEFG